MQSITAIYKVITPLFMSGEDQAKAELRVPSIKGNLRFWYRATALPHLGSWQSVKEEEQRLFGSSDTGQGQFLIRLKTVVNAGITNKSQRWNDTGSAYLGYGLINWSSGQNQNSRPFINPGTIFSVEIKIKPGFSDLASIKRALTAIGLFGGLGARSRHGFGSLSLESLKVNGREEWEAPKTKEELQKALGLFVNSLGDLNKELPAFTSFSGLSRISIAELNADPLFLLDQIGREMIRYRSYGKSKGPGKDNELPWREKAQQIFSGDHNLIYDFAHGIETTGHPERVVFGLPHNYFFSRQKPDNFNVNVNAAWLNKGGQKEKIERRTSPLFIHIHPLSDQYAAVLTLLPAVFLPPGAGVAISKVRDNRKTTVEANADYKVIHKFMDRFQQRLEVEI